MAPRSETEWGPKTRESSAKRTAREGPAGTEGGSVSGHRHLGLRGFYAHGGVNELLFVGNFPPIFDMFPFPFGLCRCVRLGRRCSRQFAYFRSDIVHAHNYVVVHAGDRMSGYKHCRSKRSAEAMNLRTYSDTCRSLGPAMVPSSFHRC